VKLTEPRLCPRCPELVLERKWFSDLKQVEIDQCPKCGGVWLDAGELEEVAGKEGDSWLGKLWQRSEK